VTSTPCRSDSSRPRGGDATDVAAPGIIRPGVRPGSVGASGRVGASDVQARPIHLAVQLIQERRQGGGVAGAQFVEPHVPQIHKVGFDVGGPIHSLLPFRHARRFHLRFTSSTRQPRGRLTCAWNGTDDGNGDVGASGTVHMVGRPSRLGRRVTRSTRRPPGTPHRSACPRGHLCRADVLL
jgi:hypothetical protein